MKVSTQWLQKYFALPLPSTAVIADALTFHAFEIEEVGDGMLDIKVLPNRAADCLSHRGIAKELSAILNIPLLEDPLRGALPAFPKKAALAVVIEDPKKCLRYMGALVKRVKVGPSPAWLKEALESVGQRSINNIVDATNYVMLDIGQPLHAFDAHKISTFVGGSLCQLAVRGARTGEKIETLSRDLLELPEGVLLITDMGAESPIGIAGVKGGIAAEITTSTMDIIVESANFDGTTIRRAAQVLKLFTDASLRFQNRPSPELAAYGMRDALALITAIAGGEVEGVADEYPDRPMVRPGVSVSLAKINSILGSNFSKKEVEMVFKRLGFETKITSESFIVTPPFERADITIPEDLVEEVGRIQGYDKISASELPSWEGSPDQARYRGIERMKDQLVEQGFTEISTQSFAKKGDVVLANPLDKTKPALRTSLRENLEEALERAKQYAPLVLTPHEKFKLFEIGTVFPKEGEYLELQTTERGFDGELSRTVAAWGLPAQAGDAATMRDNLSVAKLEDYGKDYTPKEHKLGAYQPFSIYPFIVRDVALWVSKETKAEDVEAIIRVNAGELAQKIYLFDTFVKPARADDAGGDGKKSFAFRMVLQSFERTLLDAEANVVYKKVVKALQAANKDWQVRA